MKRTAGTLLAEALELSENERVDLAAALLASLEPDEEEVEAAWRQEVAKRVPGLNAGEVETGPWSLLPNGDPRHFGGRLGNALPVSRRQASAP